MILLYSVPLIIRHLIDNVIPSDDIRLLILTMTLLLGVIILGTLLTLFYIYMMMLVRQKASLDISKKFFSRVEKTSLHNLDKIKTGDAITTINSDSSTSIDFVLNLIDDLSLNTIILGYIFVILLMLDFKLLLLSILIIPFLVISQIYFGRVLHKKTSVLRESFGDYISFLEERIRHVRLVQLFMKEQDETDDFTKKGGSIVSQTLKLSLISEYAVATTSFLTHLSLVIVLGVSSYLVIEGKMTTGTLFAFYGYQISLYNPIKKIMQSYTKFKQNMVSVEKIRKLYETTSPLPEPDNPMPLPEITNSLELRGVSINMEGKTVLDSVTLKINSPLIVGITGTSGSGKSTILNIFYRFMVPDSGQVLLNGVDIRNFDLREYRRLISLLPPAPELFDDTIINNLKFANSDATLENIHSACILADIHDDILRLKDGYDTDLGSIGDELSEGQKQRLEIARAILKNPDIYLFDETTASLDAETEKAVERLMLRLKELGKTIIFVTHRINSLRYTDMVFVVEQGKIVEEGSFGKLMNKDSRLKKLHDIQGS